MSHWFEGVESRVLFSSVGTLDPQFAAGGIASVSLPGQQFTPAGIITQADGKIVEAGTTTPSAGGNSDFTILRLNPDGTPDTSFGATGVVTLDFQSTNDSVGNIIQLRDGKLLVFGSTQTGSDAQIANRPDTDLAVARLNSDGSLDTSFHSTGKLILDLTQLRAQSYGSPIQPNPTIDMVNAAAQLSTGKILLSGTMFADDYLAGDMFLMRLNSDGSIDTSFGYNRSGLSPAQFSGDAVGNTMLVQKDGKIVLAGADTDALVTQLAIVRFNSNGVYDTSFGAGGHDEFAFSRVFDSAYALAQQSDGKLLVGGVVTRGSLDTSSAQGDLALLRLNINGQPDKTFGTQGLDGLLLYTLRNQQYAAVTSIHVQPNGSILIGGKAADNTADALALNRSLFVGRFTSKGALDKTFGAGGFSILSTPTTFPNTLRNGTQIAGALPNTIGSQANEQLYRSFLYDAEGSLSIASNGDILLLSSNSSNSTVSVASVIPDGVDLTGIFTPSTSASLLGGTKISSILTVQNIGTLASSGKYKVSLYASPTHNLSDASGIPFYTTTIAAKLNPGSSAKFKLSFPLPTQLADNNYYLIAVLNPQNSPKEINTANNVLIAKKSVGIKHPSVTLAARFLKLPSSLSAHKTVTLQLTNTGNFPATGPLTINLFASSDQTKDDADSPIGKLSTRLTGVSKTPRLLTITLTGPLPTAQDYLVGTLTFTGTPSNSATFFSDKQVALS